MLSLTSFWGKGIPLRDLSNVSNISPSTLDNSKTGTTTVNESVTKPETTTTTNDVNDETVGSSFPSSDESSSTVPLGKLSSLDRLPSRIVPSISIADSLQICDFYAPSSTIPLSFFSSASSSSTVGMATIVPSASSSSSIDPCDSNDTKTTPSHTLPSYKSVSNPWKSLYYAELGMVPSLLVSSSSAAETTISSSSTSSLSASSLPPETTHDRSSFSSSSVLSSYSSSLSLLRTEHTYFPRLLRHWTDTHVTLVASKRTQENTGRLRDITSLSFDKQGTLLLTTATSGYVHIYDWDEYSALLQQRYRKYHQRYVTTKEKRTTNMNNQSTERTTGVSTDNDNDTPLSDLGTERDQNTAEDSNNDDDDDSILLQPVHSIECSDAVLQGRWHPFRTDEIGILCSGKREIYLYDLDILPDKPTRILYRETPGTVAPDTSYEAGNTEFIFIEDPSVTSTDQPNNSKNTKATVIVAGDGKGKVRLYETRTDTSSGIRWTVDATDALRTAGSRANDSLSSSWSSSLSPTFPTSSGPNNNHHVNRASTASIRPSSTNENSLLGKRSFSSSSSSSEPNTPTILGSSTSTAATVRENQRITETSTGLKISKTTLAAYPVPSASSVTSSPPSTPIYNPVAYTTAPVRQEWKLDDCRIRALWMYPSPLPLSVPSPTILNDQPASSSLLFAATNGGGIVFWDLKKMERGAFSGRSAPTLVGVWDAVSHLSAAWNATNYVDTTNIGPSGLQYTNGSVHSWPSIYDNVSSSSTGLSAGPRVVLTSVVTDPVHPGTILIIYSNGWTSVHECLTGKVLAIHRPDVTIEEIKEEKREIDEVNQNSISLTGQPSIPHPRILTRDRLKVVTNSRSAFVLPVTSRTSTTQSSVPLLLVPQIRTIFPRPVDRSMEIKRTHYRGSVGMRIDHVGEPIHRYALSVLCLDADASRTGSKEDKFTPTGSWRSRTVKPVGTNAPIVHPGALVTLQSPGAVTTLTMHPQRTDSLLCGMNDGTVIVLNLPKEMEDYGTIE